MSMGLFLGLFSAGLAIGWMVGASGSPVAGAAIPVVFGIVAATFSFIGAKQAKGEDQVVATARMKQTLGAFGWGLFSFFIALGSGMTLGATARIHDWFGSLPKAKGLPWRQGSAQPTTLAEATELISLSEKLESLGYSKDAVETILSLPRTLKNAGQLTNLLWTNSANIKTLEDGLYRLDVIESLYSEDYSKEVIATLLELPSDSADRVRPQTDKKTTDAKIAIPENEPQIKVISPKSPLPTPPVIRVDPIVRPSQLLEGDLMDRAVKERQAKEIFLRPN